MYIRACSGEYLYTQAVQLYITMRRGTERGIQASRRGGGGVAIQSSRCRSIFRAEKNLASSTAALCVPFGSIALSPSLSCTYPIGAEKPPPITATGCTRVSMISYLRNSLMPRAISRSRARAACIDRLPTPFSRSRTRLALLLPGKLLRT